ncbi:MAG TPA: DUF4439 domain-containing protein [Kineosporiaceae bacterium]|nr:DUF4439 domain-containing protein [Kineosporiaceae bacterium]
MVLMRSGISGNRLPRRSSRTGLLSRRQLLALGATLGLVTGLTGCREQTAAAPIPLEPDELAVNRAVSAATALRTDALALAVAEPALSVLLNRMVAVHEQHLAALGSPIPSTSATPAGSSPAANADPAAAPTQTPTRTPTQLIKSEIAAAQVALRDGEAAAPAFAVLLCRIAAARIINADLLGAAIGRAPSGVLRPAPAELAGSTASAAPTAGPTAADPTADLADQGDPGDLTDQRDLSEPSTPVQVALVRLLAGQHAAVFAYPLVVARTSGSRRTLAGTLWQAHRTERDELSVQLLTARIQPAVAEPAYDVGTPPTSSAKAAALAARVERGLAALATELLAAGTAGDDDRVLGADQLAVAARRMAGWTGKPTAFPGLIERSTPAATPSATEGNSLNNPTTAANSSFTPPGALPTAIAPTAP